jgi:hypothetical protein
MRSAPKPTLEAERRRRAGEGGPAPGTRRSARPGGLRLEAIPERPRFRRAISAPLERFVFLSESVFTRTTTGRFEMLSQEAEHVGTTAAE